MTKQSLYQGRIFRDYLLNSNFLASEEGQKLINEHMLYGWLANKEQGSKSPLQETAKSEFKRQWHLNQTYSNLIEELSHDFKTLNVKPILLKGITFLKSIYTDLGDRSMSDLDLLVESRDLKKVIQVFESHGFKNKNQKKWHANDHKTELIKIYSGVETVVEIHTRLLYHRNEPQWKTVPFEVAPYSQLAPEELILYQATHLGFQHTFLKLFWVIDIHLLLSSFQNLDEEKVIKMAKENHVYNSTLMTLFILKEHFKTPMGEAFLAELEKFPWVIKKLLSLPFILNPKGNYPKYLLVKHFCKDSLKESLRYNLGWFKDRFL